MNTTGEVEFAYRVGDVISERYRVEEIFISLQGTTICRCRCLCDQSKIVFDCFSLKGTRPPYNSEAYEETKTRLLAKYGDIELLRPDWFETEEGNEKCFHVITRRPINRLRTTCGKTTIHPSRRGIEANVKSGPGDARLSGKKYGGCFFEVEIPPQWPFMSKWWLLMLILFSTVFMISLGIICYSSYLIISHIRDHGDHCLIFILAPFWAIVIAMPFAFCLVLFGRQYLRVTYTDFEVRRTIGLPDRRPSQIDDPDSGWSASVIDRCLRRQIEGKTKFLQRAEVDDIWNGCSGLSVLLLVESPKIHQIFPTLSVAEQKWLADEINTVLTHIRENPPMSP